MTPVAGPGNPKNNFSGPKSENFYLNNSQNSLWLANRMSVILHFRIPQRLSKPKLPKLGTPRPVFTPMCVYGLPIYLVISPSRDKGSGRYTMYLPSSPYRFLGAKGADTQCVCPFPLVPGEGLYQIHGQSLTHIGVNTGLGVPN